jgi:hypothetical protein
MQRGTVEMQQPGRFTFFAARRNRQRGQASAEYLLITAVVFFSAVGIVWGDFNDPAFVSVVSSFKSFFSAYSFTLSLP